MRGSKLADVSSVEATLEETVKPVTVMIVDDSKIIRRSAARLLMQAGYRVVTAADGFEALSMIAEQRPDLIFLDIDMPRLDGYQACALIRHHKVFGHVPVVMLSSEDAVFDCAHGKVVGSSHCISKPLSRENLLNAIERFASSEAVRKNR